MHPPAKSAAGRLRPGTHGAARKTLRWLSSQAGRRFVDRLATTETIARMTLSCLERPSAAADNPPDWVLAMDLFEDGTDFSRVRAVGAPDGETLYFLAPTNKPGVFDLVHASADESGGVAVVEMKTLEEQGAEWSAGVDDDQWTCWWWRTGSSVFGSKRSKCR